MKLKVLLKRNLLLFVATLLITAITHAQLTRDRMPVQKPVREKVLKPNVSTANQKPLVSVAASNNSSIAGKKRPAINMKEFKTTPAYSQRQASNSSNFTNPSRSFTMDDGSRLNIKFVKSADGGQGDNIVPKQSAPVTEKGSGDWKCVTSSLRVDARSTNFGVSDYQKQAANIYPGAIYSFENLMSGAFRSPAGTRNPLIISTDVKNMNGDTYVEIKNPAPATIQSGIAALYRRFSGSGGNGATTMQLYESYNTAEWALKLNAGGSAWGASLNNSFSTSQKSQHRYFTIDVKKTLFTINTLPPDNGFYTNSATETSEKNMMFISSVAYGVRILANLEVTFKSAAAANEFNAKYSAGVYDAHVDLKYLQNNASIETKINAYIIGGPNKGLITFDRDALIKSLDNIQAGATYQNAQPISYTLCDMAGNVVGAQSATDQFTYRNCVPANNPPVLKAAYVSVISGSDGKDRDTHYSYSLYTDKSLKTKYGIAMFNTSPPIASYTNNSDNSRFEAASTNTNQLSVNKSTGDHTPDEFYEKGVLKIAITPNGHDEWHTTSIKLRLNFSDGSSKEVSWEGVVLSHERKNVELYFQGGADGTLTPIQ